MSSSLNLVVNLERPTASQPAVMLDYIRYFQEAFLTAFPEATAIPGRNIGIKRQLLRVLLRTYRYFPIKQIQIPALRQEGRILTAICGGDFAYCLPHFLTSRKRYIYMFDAWPRSNQVLIDWARLLSIEKIFFSALQSTELFNNSFSTRERKGIWVPEGIDSRGYRYQDYEKKDIDVLEFGRRYDLYHERVTPSLIDGAYAHSFNPHGYGTVHLSKKQEVVDTFARSKISICFPSSITHPQRAEHISTMTLRYLESMVSKCLIVGAAPYDMQFLFDYKPVIEVDWANPAGQLLDILNNYRDYIPLIEKNFEAVMSAHLWSNRMNLIREYIS